MEFRKLIGFSCLLGPQVCQDNGAPVKWTNSCIMVFGAIYTIRDLRKTYKQFKVPEYMVNRQKDFSTGRTTHESMNTLIGAVRSDIEKMKKMR